MESPAERRAVLLVGGPDAGKSNYLFRLWLALDEQKGLLVKGDGLPTNLEYLRLGVERLLSGTYAEHTPSEVHDKTVIPVRASTGSFIGTLIAPDVAGEQVLRIFEVRTWSRAWEEMVSDACACLVFVRAGSDKLVAPLDWIRWYQLYDEPPSAGTEEHEGDETLPVTQVVLVDWLQFLRKAFTSRVSGGYQPRVGIVVAAWDRVPKEQLALGPDAWLRDNLPLLSQFVEANHDQFGFAVFGVSSTGGDLKLDPPFQTTYIEKGPRNFGYVVHSLSGHLEQSSDLTLPVAWALRLTDPAAD